MSTLASEISPRKKAPAEVTYAVVGNPNSGKTTLFNALTGLRQKVANYPGVTVEKKVGWCYSQHGKKMQLIDLPGAYSLSPRSRDESIARDVLLGLRPDMDAPDRVICVVDACDLDRNLYLALQVIELGLPTVVVLTMMDLAVEHGLTIDAKILEEELGVPVIPCALRKGVGLVELKLALSRSDLPEPRRRWQFEEPVETAVAELAEKLKADFARPHAWAEAEALLQLSDHGKTEIAHLEANLPVCRETLARQQKRFQEAGFDWRRSIVETRYAFARAVIAKAVHRGTANGRLVADRIDAVLTHPFYGVVVMTAVMAVIFYSIFALASYPMDWIDAGFGALSEWISGTMPDGELKSLLIDGIIAGVGGVVIFLPQILMLFFFISLMEESGYLARVALLLDRLMSRVGLHGRSFIPLLSGYACAIPGIMATRTIENERGRILTILVTPWMSCSARLPVYSLLIAAMVPTGSHSAWVKTGLMMGMYALGTAFVFLFSWIFSKTILKGEQSALVMELPAYRMPMWRAILGVLRERSMIFLKRASTVILAISILLWYLTSYPKFDSAASGEGDALSRTYAGQMGKWIEPAIKPLGFDWKIGIGLVTSFAAREVFVGTMSVIHNVEQNDEDERPLLSALREDKWPDGSRVFTPLVCLSLMVFYVFALQCLSTLPVTWRETNSWKWALFQLGYMTGVAYGMSLLVYQVGRALGFA